MWHWSIEFLRLIPTMFHQNVRGGDQKMSTHALQERQAYDIIKDLRFLAFRATKSCFAICLCGTHARFRPRYKNNSFLIASLGISILLNCNS